MEEMKTISRPQWNEEMRKELAKKIGASINQWCNNETSLEDCINKSEQILKWHINDSSFELAKQFEDEGFDPDFELIEILENVSFEKYQIQEKFIKNWVEENALRLSYSIGKKVRAKLALRGEQECEIVKLYPKTMQYGLWYEKAGKPKDKWHAIVNSENILGEIK